MKNQDSVSTEFHDVQNVLDEHLSAINENTIEIQSLFDYLQEIEAKLEKMSSRLDQLQLTQGMPLQKPAIAPLNQAEKNLFLTLYTEDQPLSYKELSDKSQLPFSIIPECIAALISKGVPLQRLFVENQLFIKMNTEFKELQAKENIVNLSLQSFM
ncbi:hypothetical protein HYX14_00400 [Candidatus Woesearchaeota archaeon]|nr:hypothetical protein [Candidatus Woesearchaeota archaeon]